MANTQPTPPPMTGEEIPTYDTMPSDKPVSSNIISSKPSEGGPNTVSDKTTTDNIAPNVTPLIVGVVIATVIATIALTLLTIVTVVVVVKRCTKKPQNFNVIHKSLALNNQVSGKNKNGECTCACMTSLTIVY